MRFLASIIAFILTVAVSMPGRAGEIDLRDSCRLPDRARNVQRGTFEGRTSIRFELGIDDTGTCPADVRRGGYNRAELRSAGNLPRDRALRISFDVFIPGDIAATGDIAFGQFHQIDEPPLALLMVSDRRYRVSAGSGLRALGAQTPRRDNLLEPSDFGRWHRIEMAARFSRGEDGYIRVSSDGVLRFEAQGATVKTEPYFKIGLYGRRDRMTGPLVVYATPPVVEFD